MKITQKLILSISLISIIAILVISIFVNKYINSENEKMIGSFTNSLQVVNDDSIQVLDGTFKNTGRELEDADDLAQIMMLNLYKNSMEKQLEIVIEQLLHYLENGQVERVDSFLEHFLNKSKDVFFIQYATKENPASTDFRTYGEEEMSKANYIISKDHKNEKSGYYVYLEMQVTLTNIRETLGDLEDIFANINDANSSLLSGFQKNSASKLEKTITDQTSKSKELVSQVTNKIIFLLIATLLAMICAIVFITKSITNPLDDSITKIKEIAAGDLTIRMNVRSKDEVGELASAINVMLESMSERAELANTIASGNFTKTIHVQSDKDTFGIALNAMVKNISAMIKEIKDNALILTDSSESLAQVSYGMIQSSENMMLKSESVASATEQMSSNINSMASAAEEMSVNIATVSSGADEMSQTMGDMANSVDEMTSSISSISQKVQDGSGISSKAANMANDATEVMKGLGNSAKEIGEVTEVIKRIAERTNLLALNATIEAASAGQAGKGFAVVANEIKELANQSAGAAEDIAKRISGVQTKTEEAVQVIDGVAGIIVKLKKTSIDIDRSVEEQNKTSTTIAASISQASLNSTEIASSISEVAMGADDMSRNSNDASKTTGELSENILEVSTEAKETDSGAQQVNTIAKELTTIAGDLKKLVSKFTFS